jgi:hypothetical protein
MPSVTTATFFISIAVHEWTKTQALERFLAEAPDHCGLHTALDTMSIILPPPTTYANPNHFVTTRVPISLILGPPN